MRKGTKPLKKKLPLSTGGRNKVRVASGTFPKRTKHTKARAGR